MNTSAPTMAIKARDLRLFFGEQPALRRIGIDIPTQQVTALIGPTGSGKSSLLRCFNRTNELIPGARTEGHVEINGEAIYQRHADVNALRRRVGIVFQQSTPFPLSISDHAAFLMAGELIEFDTTKRIFTNPQRPQTDAFLTGRLA
jgi:phosphate transport system ATP-binding protein